MSEDRVVELAAEYYREVLRDRIYERGRELVKQARKDKHRIVLLSESIAEVIEPLARELGADDFVCNRLEFVSGEATGKLLEPIIGGHDTAAWAKQYASSHDIDIARSVGYAAHAGDLLLLSAVGRPCAVNPDFALRAAARDADWPVLEYR
jgi:phosphoserine phosphatase